MTAAELCERLKLTTVEISAYVRMGMPCEGRTKGRRFDYDAVLAWIAQHGEPEEQPLAVEAIAHTRAEAARLLGLGLDGERIIARWLTIPGFPGRAGTSGKRDGHFPIAEIIEWRKTQGRGVLSHGGGDSELTDAKRRLVLLEIQEQEVQAKKRLGQLLDFDEVSRFFEQCVTNTKAVLGQIPDEILAELPADLAESLRQQIYNRVQRRIDDACIEIAQLLEGDTDPVEDDEESETSQDDRSQPTAEK